MHRCAFTYNCTHKCTSHVNKLIHTQYTLFTARCTLHEHSNSLLTPVCLRAISKQLPLLFTAVYLYTCHPTPDVENE